jgi:hypothetical protein
MVCVKCDRLAKERGRCLLVCNHTCILQCVNNVSISDHRLAIRGPFGTRAAEPKPCDVSTNLGTSEALDAGFRPLLLKCRLLFFCWNTDTADVITRTFAHQNSLKWSTRRRCHKTDGVVHNSRSQEPDHPGDREASFPSC